MGKLSITVRMRRISATAGTGPQTYIGTGTTRFNYLGCIKGSETREKRSRLCGRWWVRHGNRPCSVKYVIFAGNSESDVLWNGLLPHTGQLFYFRTNLCFVSLQCSVSRIEIAWLFQALFDPRLYFDSALLIVDVWMKAWHYGMNWQSVSQNNPKQWSMKTILTHEILAWDEGRFKWMYLLRWPLSVYPWSALVMASICIAG